MEKIKDRLFLLEKVPKNSIIAELGVFNGNYSRKILEICKPKELHLIDTWEGETNSFVDDFDCYGGEVINIKDLFSEYVKLSRKYKDDGRVYIHRGNDLDILDEFSDRYFDMIYIDTSHEYKQTIKELNACKKVIKPNGYIMGHDYSKEYGVIKAVEEFCKNNGYGIEFLTEDSPASFGIRRL